MNLRFIYIFVLLIVPLKEYSQSIENRLEVSFTSIKEGEYKKGFELLKKIAAVNNVLAQYYVAQCYKLGIGVEMDGNQAFSMFRRAAERGYVPAMKELANCYLNGIGVDKSTTKAEEWEIRFNSRPKVIPPYDLEAIYMESLRNPVLIAQVESTNNDQSLKNPQQPQIINYTIIQQASLDSKPQAEHPETPTTVVLKPKSDVDVDIPIIRGVNENLFALIIANENYHDVSIVANALNDGEIFGEYCHKLIGIPQNHIHIVKDATLGNIKREISWLQQIAEAYHGDASFILYYAGHGIPDEKTKDAYILPVDGFTGDLTTCYSLNEVYSLLGKIPAQKTIFFIDACFSGSKRGEGMLMAARGISIKSKSVVPTGKTLVISSAQGDETAYPYEDQNHGLFTYYLLKKMKETKGDIEIGELVNSVRENVAKKSIVINGKSQTPTATPSKEIIDEWQKWNLSRIN